MPYANCPYCQKDQRIDHAGGYGVAEGRVWGQQCACGKEFRYMTEITYTTFCQEGDHILEPWQGLIKQGMYMCKTCGYMKCEDVERG